MPNNSNYINVFGTLLFNRNPLRYHHVKLDVSNCDVSRGCNSDDRGHLWFDKIPACSIGNTYGLTINDNEKEIDSDFYFNKTIPPDGNIGIIIVNSESARQLTPIGKSETASVIEDTMLELLERDELESINPESIKEQLIQKMEHYLSNNKENFNQPADILLENHIKNVLAKKDLQNNRIVLAISFLINSDLGQALEQIENEATITEYALNKSIAENVYNIEQVTLLHSKTITEYKWSNIINKELGNPERVQHGKARILELKNLELK